VIDELKRINGAVATKTLVPILTNYHFYDNRVQANNGVLCIDSPSTIPLNITVPAKKFFSAVKLTKGNLKLNVTQAGKLSLSSGKFRALIQLADHNSYPRSTFNETTQYNCEYLMHFIKPLVSFISEDASRPWSMSILIKDGYAWATNNIVIARIKVPFDWEAVIPRYAVMSLLEQEKQPNAINVQDNKVGFMYDDEVWMQCLTYASKWPNVSGLIQEKEAPPLPMYFKESLEALLPFCEDPKLPIFSLGSFGVRTTSEATGAEVDLNSFPDSKFRAEPLLQVAGIADKIDFSTYPKPCYFSSSIGVDGVIIGVL